MVDKLLLLHGVKHAEFVFVFLGSVAEFNVNVDFTACGEVILVFEVGEALFTTKFPSKKRIMCDECHVVRVDGAEWGQAIAHNGE